METVRDAQDYRELVQAAARGVFVAGGITTGQS